MEFHRRFRGAFVSIAVSVVATTTMAGMSSPALANPLPVPPTTSSRLATAVNVEPSPAAPPVSFHDGPSPEVPNLTPAEVVELKSQAKLAVPSTADRTRATNSLPPGTTLLASPGRLLTGAPRTKATTALAALYAPNYQVHATTNPSRATYRNLKSWRLVNNTSLYSGVTTGGADDYVAWGKSYLVQQPDGNLVLYDENNRARWAMGTAGNRGAFSRLLDGTLIVYNSRGTVLRYTTPQGLSSWNLHVQEDGNVVMYAPTWVVKWATNTNH